MRYLLCGIDPGLASGGIVLLDQEKVLETASLVEKKGAVKKAKEEARILTDNLDGWGDKEFIAASLRTVGWLARAEEVLNDWEKKYGTVQFYAVESFVDQPSRASQEKAGLLRKRWQTPFVMGGLATLLARRGVTAANGRLVYQNAGVVIRQWHKEIALLEKGGSIYPGDEKITNDHLRKALVHALALNIRLKRKEDIFSEKKKKDLD